MRHCSTLLAALSLVLMASCVVNLTDQTRITPSQPLPFNGYSSVAGGVVRVQAKNHRTGAWDTIAAFTATTTPTTIAGDTLYAWSGSVTFTQANGVDDWRCYFAIPATNPCQVPLPAADAQVRVVQSDGTTLTTFDSGGLSCVLTKLNEGKGWLVAGHECRDNDSPVINLRWVL